MTRPKLTEEQAKAVLGELSPDSKRYKIVFEFAALTPQFQDEVLRRVAMIHRSRIA